LFILSQFLCQDFKMSDTNNKHAFLENRPSLP